MFSSPVARQNIQHLHARVGSRLLRNLWGTLHYHWFRLDKPEDAWYGVGGGKELLRKTRLSLFTIFAEALFSDLSNPLWSGLLFAWLFLVMLWLAFGVVRHADVPRSVVASGCGDADGERPARVSIREHESKRVSVRYH